MRLRSTTGARLKFIPHSYRVLDIRSAWIPTRALPSEASKPADLVAGKPSTYAIIIQSIDGAKEWLANDAIGFFGPIGIAITALVVVLLCYMGYRLKIEIGGNPGAVVRLSLLFTLMMPFLLVRMHERYFYPADVISILYGFYFPRKFYVPLLVVGTSLLSYCPYLLRTEIVPMPYLSMLAGFTIIIVLTDIIRNYLIEPEPPKAHE